MTEADMKRVEEVIVVANSKVEYLTAMGSGHDIAVADELAKDALALRSLLAERQRLTEWQQMDTVPTDGRWFWVKLKTGMVSAFRYDAKQATHDCKWFAGFGWYSSGQFERFIGWAEMEQPPAPPTERTT